MIPIRIDIDIEGVKLRDCFTWNLHESLTSPEEFARIFADDLETSYSTQIARTVSEQIKQQCNAYSAASNDDAVNEEITIQDDDEEIRIVIKLDFNVGNKNFKDQFEWPLYSTKSSPENFAKLLCSDLGIGGQYISMISHNIREQVILARLNYDGVQAPPLRVFRAFGTDDEWMPKIEEMSDGELERLDREKERSTRRLKRSHRAPRFIPATLQKNEWKKTVMLPKYNEVKEPQKTIAYQNYQPKAHEKNFFVAGAELVDIDDSIIDDQVELMKKNINHGGAEPNSNGSSTETSVASSRRDSTTSNESVGKSIHRGFGASAKVFNEEGDFEMSEWRKNWRCSWCLLSGKFTPTLRKGPLGGKTLCNSCGIWYGKHKTMPKERFQENINTV